MKALLVAAAVFSGYLVARASPPTPDVVIVSAESLEALGGVRGPRGSVLPPPAPGQTSTPGQTTAPGQTATPQVPCTQAAPDSSATCVNGFWQTAAAASTGVARFDRANGCVTVQPMSDMICRNGLWTLRGADPPAATPTASSLNAPAQTTTDPNAASTLDPTRPPSVATPSASTSTTSPPGVTSSGTGTCLSTRPPILPTQSLACVNGTWVVR